MLLDQDGLSSHSLHSRQVVNKSTSQQDLGLQGLKWSHMVSRLNAVEGDV